MALALRWVYLMHMAFHEFGSWEAMDVTGRVQGVWGTLLSVFVVDVVSALYFGCLCIATYAI
jgi:hypothetical protein